MHGTTSVHSTASVTLWETAGKAAKLVKNTMRLRPISDLPNWVRFLRFRYTDPLEFLPLSVPVAVAVSVSVDVSLAVAVPVTVPVTVPAAVAVSVDDSVTGRAAQQLFVVPLKSPCTHSARGTHLVAYGGMYGEEGVVLYLLQIALRITSAATTIRETY